MRRPIDQRSLSLLMKRPGAMSRFLATGALPSVAKPLSPLITLLESLSSRERSRIVGLKVGPALGYNGSRQFHTTHQALSWLIPANLSTTPASQSWRGIHTSSNAGRVWNGYAPYNPTLLLHELFPGSQCLQKNMKAF